ncbi:hypothetical protein RR48_07449 [Papilio machaon]|uniref:Uncharacterized protein n=1 Tax=Papilio machaon TaxID=76193 RepID=A0A194RRB7_PAPMA|nr:hypothetical protein RR48_07449 [Papilio machaon]
MEGPRPGETAFVITVVPTPGLLWADPGGTAMPGRPVTGVERAPNIPSLYKNQFNILVPQCGNFQILS